MSSWSDFCHPQQVSACSVSMEVVHVELYLWNFLMPLNKQLDYLTWYKNTLTSALGQVPVRSKNSRYPDLHWPISGALVVLTMFHMNWSVKHCITVFDNLARQLFPKHKHGWLLCGCVCEFLVCYLADSCYNAVPLELNLKEVFGTCLLFGNIKSHPSRRKIGITTTTISNATLCLFTNYNGTGHQHQDSSKLTVGVYATFVDNIHQQVTNISAHTDPLMKFSFRRCMLVPLAKPPLISTEHIVPPLLQCTQRPFNQCQSKLMIPDFIHPCICPNSDGIRTEVLQWTTPFWKQFWKCSSS